MANEANASPHDQTYPAGWPGCCPPKDAIEVEAEMYRAVEGNPPGHTDFQNAVEANKFRNSDPCARLALSLNATLDGVRHSFKLFPWRAGWQIATIGLRPHHGRVKNSPSKAQPDHVSWWPYAGVTRHSAVTGVIKT
jgi:hypothetical protein